MTLRKSYLLLLACLFSIFHCKSWGRFWEVGTVTINALGGRGTGELWTNTLIGSATGPVASVEISVAGGGWNTATGTNSWRYAIPFSANLKVGKSYTFSARALGDDGTLLASQTGILLRQQNHDMNGDGYADLVVAARARTSANGSVYVFHGTASGFNTTAAATIQGEASGDGLGEGVLTGDYNNDGFTDLIVQARDRNAGAGASQGVAYLLPGSTSGFSNFSVNSSTHVNISGELAGSTFGSRAAITDANGDGFRDILLTAYLPASSAGAVYYLPGPGFSSQNASTITNKISGITTGDAFGIALSLKDLNGDGYPDMIAGAYNRNSGAGAGQGTLSIFFGQGAGFSSQNSAAANLTITGEAAGDNFSWPIH